MVEIKTTEDYKELIKMVDDDKLEKRFEKILDIRKFEIELYWKRATYFWAFIGVSFAGYGITIDKPGAAKFQFMITCLGLLFAVAFFMVNKASKFWQENWEAHTDWSESSVIGPLYKITLPKSKRSKLISLSDRYSASVSRINIYISFVLIVMWVCLLVWFCCQHFKYLHFPRVLKSWEFYYYLLILSFTFFSCYYLLYNTTSDLEEADDDVKFVMRD